MLKEKKLKIVENHLGCVEVWYPTQNEAHTLRSPSHVSVRLPMPFSNALALEGLKHLSPGNFDRAMPSQSSFHDKAGSSTIYNPGDHHNRPPKPRNRGKGVHGAHISVKTVPLKRDKCVLASYLPPRKRKIQTSIVINFLVEPPS